MGDVSLGDRTSERMTLAFLSEDQDTNSEAASHTKCETASVDTEMV